MPQPDFKNSGALRSMMIGRVLGCRKLDFSRGVRSNAMSAHDRMTDLGWTSRHFREGPCADPCSATTRPLVTRRQRSTGSRTR